MTTLSKIKLKQGLHRESTQYEEEGKWYDGNHVRFRSGKPENMRGYETKVSTAFEGSARDLITYQSGNNKKRAVFGTPDRLYEHDGDRVVDITPITTAVTLANVFGTSSGSTRVCCSDAAHGRVVGDYVYFTSSAAFNNVSLQGNTYEVVSVDSAAVFTISVTDAANATASDTGSATFNYLIPTGNSIAVGGTGYGAADFNAAEPTSVGISKITTTESNTLVTVSCAAAHGGAADDTVFFIPSSIGAVPATVGGNLILTKSSLGGVAIGGPEFTIVSINGTQLIFNVETAASAGGDVTSNIDMTARIYPQEAGSAAATQRSWNEPASADATDIVFDITQWSLDNWGDDVVANRSGSNIFYFESDASTVPIRATSITTSPISVNSIVVSPNDRHLICLGSNSYSPTATVSGTFDPMLVRWSDQDDRTNWVPSVSSTSGEVVLTDGTKIIGGLRSRSAIHIWTDNAMWTMQYVGPPFTFRFTPAGTNCGMIAPHAAVDYNGISYWMGYDNFYKYDGQVRVLDCTVRRFIFDRLATKYSTKVYTGVNSEFKEIIWLYASDGSGVTECDSYVIFSPENNYWTYGTGVFTTFADKEVFGNTITTGVSINADGSSTGNNKLFNNEPADYYTENNRTITSFIESADFDIEDGNQVLFMNRLIPDFDLNTGKLRVKIITKKYPESNEEITKEFDVTQQTDKINFRARGRQAKIRVSCSSQGSSWQWGSVRLGFQGDGQR